MNMWRREKPFDLCVYRATPAGIFAAVAAARNGLKAVIIEPSPYIGGLITSGLNATDIGGPIVVRGMLREFLERCGKHYGTQMEERPESRVAAFVFAKMMREVGVTKIRGEIVRVNRAANRIASVQLRDESTIQAKYFIDASYEGDLLPLANVSYAIGRESAEQYGERHAGVRAAKAMIPYYGAARVSGVGKDKKPLPFLERTPIEIGAGDDLVQAFSFRLTLTDDPERKVPFPKPADYRPDDFELFRRLARAAPQSANIVDHITRPNYGGATTYRSGYFNLAEIANGKRDMNSGHVLPLNLPHYGTEWVKSDYPGRQKLLEKYREYTLSALHFMQTDESVPGQIREFISRFGLPADEYVKAQHFPPALYVREGRRLVGDKVFTENDVCGSHLNDDAVALGKYHLDCKPTRWVLSKSGLAMREGMFFFDPKQHYLLPYWAMTPKRSECENLLVPVAVSASHVGFSSIRMEPHWMQLGEAAGCAVSIAGNKRLPVQKVPPRQIREKMGKEAEAITTV